MPQIDYEIKTGNVFRQTCTNTALLKFGSDNTQCELCVTPGTDLFTPTGSCFDFLNDGVQLPRRVLVQVDNPTGPGLSTFSDSVSTTYQGNAGTLYRTAYVQGPSPQIVGAQATDSQLLQGLLSGSTTCTKTNNLTPNPLITIDSGWWQDTGFREWLPTSDTTNINAIVLEQEAWPSGAQTSDERTVAAGSMAFQYSLNKVTGLLTCSFTFRYNSSNPGTVIPSSTYQNAYLTNAFLRDSDGARIEVAAADAQLPAGFDPTTQDVPDYQISSGIQINADGTWYQTGGTTVSGGTGSITLRLG